MDFLKTYYNIEVEALLRLPLGADPNTSLIQGLVDHAEKLAQKLQYHPADFILCHSPDISLMQ